MSMNVSSVSSYTIYYLIILATTIKAFRAKPQRTSFQLPDGMARSNSDQWSMDGDRSVRNDPHSLLINYVRRRVDASHPPVFHASAPLIVHINMGLYRIIDLDQRASFVRISGFIDFWWMDTFAHWNRSNFNSIDRVFIPSSWVWKPRLFFKQSVDGLIPNIAYDSSVEVNFKGRIRLLIPITTRAICPINVKYFPFDVQQCRFVIASWTYSSELLKLYVNHPEIFLDDFTDNQEWLLESAKIFNGSTKYMSNETYSAIYIIVMLRRQSFYYVFNFVLPTTVISIVAIIGFHAPINATGRRETKFRLGIMTLLSMSVMLLMLVDEMKFSLSSIPGQRGSFSDVPLLGVFHMVQMLIIGLAACTCSIFVHLEKYALQNQYFHAVPWCLRFLTSEKLICCYVPRRFRIGRGEKIERNHNISTRFITSISTDSNTFGNIIPVETNFTECHRNATGIDTSIECRPTTTSNQRIELLVSLMREFIQTKKEMQRRHTYPCYWERVLNRLETISLIFYIILILITILLFMNAEKWY